MNEKEKVALEKSIEHHIRMFEWVKKQPPKERPNSYRMLHELGEHTGSEYCALCQLFFNNCSICSLNKKFGFCSGSETNKYIAYSRGKTNALWLKKEKKFIEQLKSLREE